MKRADCSGAVIRLDVATNAPYNMESERERNVIGCRIKEGRHRIGMNLDAFCEHLKDYGVSVGRGGLSKWETGATIPNA